MIEKVDKPACITSTEDSLKAGAIFSLAISAAILISTFGPQSAEIVRAREQVAEHRTILRVHNELLVQNEMAVSRLEAMFSPPTAVLALSPERALGETISITFEVEDADGDFAFANLWVFTPRRGWVTVKFDNSQIVSGAISEVSATATTVGVHTRKFLLDDGAGNYQFALAAVDRTGRRADAPTLTVLITEARSGSCIEVRPKALLNRVLFASGYHGRR